MTSNPANQSESSIENPDLSVSQDDQPEEGSGEFREDNIRQNSPLNPRVMDKSEEATEEA